MQGLQWVKKNTEIVITLEGSWLAFSPLQKDTLKCRAIVALCNILGEVLTQSRSTVPEVQLANSLLVRIT